MNYLTGPKVIITNLFVWLRSWRKYFRKKSLVGISNFLSRKLRKLHFTENSADVIHRLFKCFEFEWRHTYFFKCVNGILVTSFNKSSVTENIVRLRDCGYKIPTKVRKKNRFMILLTNECTKNAFIGICECPKTL